MSEARYRRHVEGKNLLKPHTVVVPGFGETAGGLAPFADELSREGHNVSAIEHPTTVQKKEYIKLIPEYRSYAETWYEKNRPDIEVQIIQALLDSIPETLFIEAISIIKTIEEEIKTIKNEPVTAVGHSQGAFALTIAAFLRPDLFPNKEDARSTIILMNPAGFTGREGVADSKSLKAAGKIKEGKRASATEMFGNAARTLSIIFSYSFAAIASYVRSLPSADQRKRIDAVDQSTFDHIVGNTLNLGFIREGSDMANTDIVPFLEVLNGNGVHISVVYDSGDSLFPKGKIQKRLEKIPYVEQHESKGEGHFLPVRKPREAAQLVQKILGG